MVSTLFNLLLNSHSSWNLTMSSTWHTISPPGKSLLLGALVTNSFGFCVLTLSSPSHAIGMLWDSVFGCLLYILVISSSFIISDNLSMLMIPKYLSSPWILPYLYPHILINPLKSFTSSYTSEVGSKSEFRISPMKLLHSYSFSSQKMKTF